MKNKYLLLFVFLLISNLSIGQTYTMNSGANGTFSSCTGTFVDKGGAGGNYAANQNGTMTFCPATPGDLIKISFTTFNTEGTVNGTCYDYLDLWQGNTVGAAGTQNVRYCGAMGAFTITSSSPSGCLSFQFISDGFTQLSGWTATVSCITPCTPPTAAMVSTATLNICSPTALAPGSLTVPFDASNSSTIAPFNVVKYEWFWGDGTTSTTTTGITTHTFPGVGLYQVRLRVRNNNFSTDPAGCLSANAVVKMVRILPEPSFTGTTSTPISTVCGGSATLNGLVKSQTITQATPAIISGPTSLPDGTGASYLSGLDFSGLFAPGATMTAGCYPTVKFDIEHSATVDLNISLIAPSGETVMLFNRRGDITGASFQPTKFGTCSDGADDLVPGCVAGYTVVNSGGVPWMPTTGKVTTTSATCGVYSGTCEAGDYYKPQTYTSDSPFTSLNGASLNGVWTLKILDNDPNDDGVLSNWSLTFPSTCYAGLQSETPDLTTATWSTSGSGPAIPAQTTTSTGVTDPGPAACPTPGTCAGNQLSNNINLGPFNNIGSYVYDFTVTDEFGCQYRRSATVNVTALCPTANISYAGTPFCNATAIPQNVTLTGTAAYTGGTYSSTVGLTINPVTGAITPSTSTPGAYTVTYTIPSGGCCAVPVTATTSVIINAQPNAGTDGNTTICDSNIASIDLYSLITGEQAGGTWTRLTGTGGTFNAGAGTFTPAAGATTSTFQYSLTGTAPCVNDVSVATININAQPNAGTDGNTTICDSSVSSINLYSLITGEQAGGTWIRLSGTGGTFNAGAGTFAPAAGATTSTFQYSLIGTAPCVNDVSVATININAQPNAGSDGNATVCDSNGTSINLYSLITGEQAGGTWTRLTGAGGTFNAGAGTYTPALGATTSTFQYSLTGTAPCINDVSVATVIINPTLAPVINCGASTTTSVQFTWTAVVGATGYNVVYQINASPVVNIGTIGNVLSYSVTGLSPGDSVLITLTPTGGVGTCFTFNTLSCVANNCTPPTANISYSTPFCNSTITSQNVTLTGTGVYAGGTYSSTAGLIINPATGAIIPSTSTAGTYIVTYTIPAAAGCSIVTATTSVIINAQPNAGTDGNTTVCDSSVASIDLYSLITGEQAGGTWTRLTGTGGTFNAGAGTFLPAAGATTSTFQYSLTGTAPCVNDVSVATININAQPNAGTDGNTTVCDSSITLINLYSLIIGEQAGGIWTRLTGTGGTFNTGAGTFLPAAGATTSTFQYSLTGTAPCVNDVSVATVNINAQPNAGADGNATICDSSVASINLYSLITGEQAGGAWTRLTGTGGTFNAGAGTFIPAPGATNSTFQYSLTGTAPCVNDVSVATVNINAQPNAGTDGNTIICDSSVTLIDLYSLITGEQAGGTWARLTGTGGTFNTGTGTFTPAAGATTSTFQYSLTGTAPCVNDVSIATININAQPNAGTDGNATICDSSTALIDLYNLITGEQTGGTWTRLTGSGGTFNAGAGTFTPAAGATTSTFQYSLTGTAPCVNDVSIVTVNINAQPNAGTDGNTTICDSSIASIDLYGLIIGEHAGGTWTRLTGTGGTFNAGTGIFTPAAGATNSTFQYSLTGTAPCVNDVSVAAININAQPNAGTDGATTICDLSVIPIDLYNLITGEQVGGTWTRLTGTGGTFNAGTGIFTPAAGATTSTFQYNLNGTAPCVNDASIASVNINGQLDAGTDGTTTVCDSSVASIDLYSLITGEQAGGTWTRLTGTGGTFNSAAGTFVPAPGATTSTFQYSLTATAPCVNDDSVATININAQPNAGTDGNTTVCDSSVASIDLYSLITSEQAGGVWIRLTGTGGTFNAGAGTFTLAAGATTSTFQYNLNGTAPCVNDVSIASVNINGQLDAGTDGTTTVCDSSVASIDLYSLITGEQAGGTWTRLTGTGGTFNAAAGTFIPAPGATTSTFQYTLAGTAPCVNDDSVATVNINAQPNAGIDGNTAVCDSSIASIDLYSLITGEQVGGTWTRLTGTGGTFNAAAGTFIPAPGTTTSTFQYSLTGTAPCVNDVSVATVNINAQPNAGIDGNTTVCDSSVASIDLYSLISGEQTGGTWTRLTGIGGTFNAGAGTFTPSAGVTTSTFQYSLTGTAPCINDVSVATVNINGQLDAGTDGNTTICDSNVSSIDLYSLITGEQTGGIWTRLTGAGGTFNAGTGTFISNAGATTSTFEYTLTGTAPCVGDSSVATITINSQPDAGEGGKTTACDDDTVNLYDIITGEQPGGIWTRTSGTGGIFNAAAGTFTSSIGATLSTFIYTLTSVGPCVDDSSVATVDVSVKPDVLTIATSSYFTDATYISIIVTPASPDYEYSLDGGAFQDENIFNNVTRGLHEVLVRNKKGCGTLAGTTVIINYPKFFTPNGDGYHETWNIFDLSDQKDSKIFIFDRFGKLIKEIQPSGNGWDGTFNGQPLPSTDYWFVVYYLEQSMSKEFRAHFSLKR